MPTRKPTRGGRRLGAGRKSKAEEVGLNSLLNEAISQAERKAIIRDLVSQAKGGNIKAAALLLAYIYGKPKELHDVAISSKIELEYVNDWRNNNSES